MNEDEQIESLKTSIEDACASLFEQIQFCTRLETLLEVSEKLDGIEAFCLEAGEKIPENAHVFSEIINTDIVPLRKIATFRFARLASAEVRKAGGQKNLH